MIKYLKKTSVFLFLFLFVFSAYTSASEPKITYDSFTNEKVYDYFTLFISHNDHHADGHILKVEKPNGEVSYRLKIFDFFGNYRGELIPETGKLKVYNSSIGDYEFMDLVPVDYQNNGRGGYTFIYNLPNDAINLARQGKVIIEKYIDNQFDIRCTVYNNRGEKVTYDGWFDLKHDFEDGL